MAWPPSACPRLAWWRAVGWIDQLQRAAKKRANQLKSDPSTKGAILIRPKTLCAACLSVQHFLYNQVSIESRIDPIVSDVLPGPGAPTKIQELPILCVLGICLRLGHSHSPGGCCARIDRPADSLVFPYHHCPSGCFSDCFAAAGSACCPIWKGGRSSCSERLLLGFSGSLSP